MSIAVTTPAPTLLLTTLQRVKDSLGLTSSVDDAFLTEKIKAASGSIDTFCKRIFARQAYTQLTGAYGGIEFTCGQAPVVAVAAVTYRGSVLTDVTIQDADAGFLYRQAGFDWTTQRAAGLGASFRGLDYGSPLPIQEEPLWQVDFTAGFILPGQNLLASGTISAASADNSFNDSASLFPALSKAGDIIEASGFTNPANNGRFVIMGAPTAAKIKVTAALTTEAAAAGRTLLVQTLPSDVEQSAIETAISLYSNRNTDSNIVEKQAGLMRLRYSETMGGPGMPRSSAYDFGLPAQVAARLRQWVR